MTREGLAKRVLLKTSFSSKRVKQVSKSKRRIIKFIKGIIMNINIIITVKQEVMINSDFQLLK